MPKEECARKLALLQDVRTAMGALMAIHNDEVQALLREDFDGIAELRKLGPRANSAMEADSRKVKCPIAAEKGTPGYPLAQTLRTAPWSANYVAQLENVLRQIDC